MSKPRLLLHVCCAPCSTHVIDVLKDRYEVEVFFYNPNIHPEREYQQRMEESRTYCERIGMPFHTGAYNTQEWFRSTAGHEEDEEGGDRCRICYRLRLEKTAEKAVREGFQYFTTTLTISPHKDAGVINAIGREVSRKHGVGFLEADFKKKEGFKHSVELSRKYGMRRQSYCGCVYSQDN